ncbi:hypothetical protein KIMH_15410 [Bombiscardovia apis]|uniref:Uncharacterized protein n=1 Tax=Bombiscardovia apis TaxID=2932182 RepID=A0ABN6SL49_9BIFI|nr:hypothetical protein [Bombiscardovia apis]BDR55430.1 hypothetical protein KIMH_15410 [Bombiscardovia apis]
MDSKTLVIVIVVALTNIGTLIVASVTLWKIGKLLRKNPPRQEDDANEPDGSWHSWRLWRPSDDPKISQSSTSQTSLVESEPENSH